MVDEGLVLRQARGVYVAARHALTAQHTLARVAKRVPRGGFCLLTALRFHGLTTQSPAEVWITLEEIGSARATAGRWPPRGPWSNQKTTDAR